MKKIALVSIIVICIDQIIKALVNKCMILNSSIDIIPNFFSLTYVRNYGAAFSILNGNRFLLIFITILAIIFIYFIFVKKNCKTYELFVYGLLFGGIIGNLIDRVFYGYVIDYLDFNLFGYAFPVFNFADICIVLSILFILILSFRGNIDGKHIS